MNVIERRVMLILAKEGTLFSWIFPHSLVRYTYLCAAEYVDVAGDDIMSLTGILDYQQIDSDTKIQLHHRK